MGLILFHDPTEKFNPYHNELGRFTTVEVGAEIEM
jgi:hypothetical protein